MTLMKANKLYITPDKCKKVSNVYFFVFIRTLALREKGGEP